MSVCDSCLSVAYDLEFESVQDATRAMQDLGLDLPDHNCDEVETGRKCDCACREYK